MDDRRFDRLARAVAGSGSRRGILRGLAGAVALVTLGRQVPRAAAQTGYLGPGEACFDDSQCGNTRYSSMYCDDNGFAYDGPRNCCTYENGYCYSDEGCCGSLICLEGSCGAEGQGVPLGSQCFSTAQCIGGGDAVACSDNGGFVPACCLIGGQVCTADLDCCLPNACIAGYCQ